MAINKYFVNKRKKGQRRFFKCACCNKEFDFENSRDYIGAVIQWESYGKKCYACANRLCHCNELGGKNEGN